MKNYFSKKVIGIACVLIAAGMILMMITNRFAGLVVVMLLLFVGYNCLFCD